MFYIISEINETLLSDMCFPKSICCHLVLIVNLVPAAGRCAWLISTWFSWSNLCKIKMENWQIILIGSFGGILLVWLTFWYCFDSLFQAFNTSRQNENSGNTTYYTSMRYSQNPSRFRADIERFVYEEFESPHHEVVAVVLSQPHKCIGIVAFCQERKIEYFSETFPTCCKQLQDQETNDHKTRAGLAALSLWSDKWTMANSVSFLIDDRAFVEASNSSDEAVAAASVVKDRVDRFEQKHDFHLACQWTDNFICDIAANSELWEGLIESGKKLLQSENMDEYSMWKDFACEEWERSRCRLNSAHFHQLPHAGEMTPDEDSSDSDETKALLVDI